MDESLSLPAPSRLDTWQEEARRRYPNFRLVWQVRGTDADLHYSLHFEPRRTGQFSPPAAGACFPTRPAWYPIEMFWREGGTSELDFIYSLYPDELSLYPALPAPVQSFTASTLLLRVMGTAALVAATALFLAVLCYEIDTDPGISYAWLLLFAVALMHLIGGAIAFSFELIDLAAAHWRAADRMPPT